jgi:hypothetical protein
VNLIGRDLWKNESAKVSNFWQGATTFVGLQGWVGVVCQKNTNFLQRGVKNFFFIFQVVFLLYFALFDAVSREQ